MGFIEQLIVGWLVLVAVTGLMVAYISKKLSISDMSSGKAFLLTLINVVVFSALNQFTPLGLWILIPQIIVAGLLLCLLLKTKVWIGVLVNTVSLLVPVTAINGVLLYLVSSSNA